MPEGVQRTASTGAPFVELSPTATVPSELIPKAWLKPVAPGSKPSPWKSSARANVATNASGDTMNS